MNNHQSNIVRRNPLTRKWIVYLTKPIDLSKISGNYQGGAFELSASPGDTCEFCPNTRNSVRVIMDYNDGQSFYQNKPQNMNWQIRVIPAPEPVFRIEGALNRRGDRFYDTMNAIGAHELVILHKDHWKTVSKMDCEDIRNIFYVVRERMLDLAKDPKLGHQYFFINQGNEANSIPKHPCGQLFTLPFLPEKIQKELSGTNEWYQLKERCLLCDIVNAELDAQAEGKSNQILFQNDSIVALIPYFGSHPFETWILPRSHMSDFKRTENHQLYPFAEAIHFVLQRMTQVLGDISLTISLLAQPNKQWGLERGYWMNIDSDWHWRLLVIPRIQSLSEPHLEFFNGTGSRVNPLLPETAIGMLRG